MIDKGVKNFHIKKSPEIVLDKTILYWNKY